jgi:hypothetical protein
MHPVDRSVVLPDGRTLRGKREGALRDWVVYVDGAEDRSVSDRWLLAAVSELLQLPSGRKPDWVRDAISELSGTDTTVGRRYPCPCCDFLTLTKPPTGTFQLCPVCRWEDDNIQFADLDYEGGANQVSLREARENFRRFGKSDTNLTGEVRPPLPEEYP